MWGQISLSKSHPSSQDSLWTQSVLSLGAPVKCQLLQERIRQESMCSHILTLLVVTVQHRVVTHSWADVQAALIFHLCLCILTTPFHAQRHATWKAYVSRLEDILWFIPAPSGNHHSVGSLPSSISFIFFDKNTMFSQSGYPNMPCELGEGREDHPPYPHPSLLSQSFQSWRPPRGQPPPLVNQHQTPVFTHSVCPAWRMLM